MERTLLQNFLMKLGSPNIVLLAAPGIVLPSHSLKFGLGPEVPRGLHGILVQGHMVDIKFW